MPVFQSGIGRAPAWGELDNFQIITLAPGETRHLDRAGKVEKLVVAAGSCQVVAKGATVQAERGAKLDLVETDGGGFEIRSVLQPTTLVWFQGRWGTEVGGCGLFAVDNDGKRVDRGGKVSYPKTTGFDRHFHDCDEYWVIYAGRGVAVSEEQHYEVGPGDCVATRMGHHHDFPLVSERVQSVYFETTMRGRKRRGHLWEHQHGSAELPPAGA